MLQKKTSDRQNTQIQVKKRLAEIESQLMLDNTKVDFKFEIQKYKEQIETSC